MLASGVAMGCIYALIGLGFILIFPLTFISSAFVPPETMPAALQWFAEWNPFSITVNAIRALFIGDPAGNTVWGAIAWSRETGVVQSTHRERLEIMDRVGGGDSFASGLIFGLLDGQSLQTAVEYGAAHGALAMTTPGDTTMATKAEVLKLAGGGSARVDR